MLIEVGGVIRSTRGGYMFILVLESSVPEDPRCARVLILDCHEDLIWEPGQVGLLAHSALRNGNFEVYA